MKCDQCGREGTRGFTILEPHWDEFWEMWTERFVFCSNLNACYKRRPNQLNDDE